MGLLSTLLSRSQPHYHKLSSSNSSCSSNSGDPSHPRRNHCTADPCTNLNHHHHHRPMPNHRRRMLETERQDRREARKADHRYEAARQQEIDAANTRRAARAAALMKEEEEREREEEVKEALRQRIQAVEDKKERHRREGELWKGRYDVKNLDGYCLDV